MSNNPNDDIADTLCLNNLFLHSIITRATDPDPVRAAARLQVLAEAEDFVSDPDKDSSSLTSEEAREILGYVPNAPFTFVPPVLHQQTLPFGNTPFRLPAEPMSFTITNSANSICTHVVCCVQHVE